MFRRILARAAGWFGYVPVPDAWSFPAESVAELSRRLVAAGDGATLSVIRYTDGGLMRLKLRVRAAGGAELRALDGGGDINESRPCPPFKCEDESA